MSVVVSSAKRLTQGQHGSTVSQPNGWTELLALSAAPAMPRVLRVHVTNKQAAGLYPDAGPEAIGFYGGDPHPLSPLNHPNQCADFATLRIRYGCRLQRTIYADLQPGDYFLPTCENVQVAAARWNARSKLSTTVYPVDVNLELAPAGPAGGDYRPITLTSWMLLTFATTTPIAIPAGAYAFDMQTEALSSGNLDYQSAPIPTDWDWDGTDGPIFETTFGGGVYKLLNLQTREEFPGGMQPISGPAVGTGGPRFIYVTNKATAGVHVLKTIFYVR